MTDTPMLDKMSAVQGDSQTIGEFLEWLGTQSLQVGSYGQVEYPDEPCPGYSLDACEDGVVKKGTHKAHLCRRCNGTGRITITRSAEFRPIHSIEAILAKYFDIDLLQAEHERAAILASLR